jgi:hypothetical protein
MNNQIVYNSTDLSILAQFITGIFGIKGLYVELDPINQILKSILGLELIVQIIELGFYMFILRKLSLEAMASIRYFDWFITTPTMLITTIIYFKYEEYIEKFKNLDNSEFYKKKLENLKFFEFIKENKEDVITIVICNFLMLLFGYLGEIGVIDIFSACVFGFVFFLMSFYVIYSKYAKFSKIGNQMFILLFVIWSIYGFAYLFNPIYKNITFNGLDVIAKNFFGLYLYFKILQVK